MKSLFAAAALLGGVLAFANTAHAVEYTTVLADKSQVTFTSKQMGVPVDGRFQRFTASVRFDPARAESAQARVDIDLASIDAGSKDANDEVAGKGWFNVREFPRASFVSESIKPLGGNQFEARGKMSLKGRTRDMSIRFSYKPEGKLGVFEGTLPLLRTQFGVGDGPWADTSVVADEVPIRFRLVAQ